mgnify:CR=1 FL=1|jgi:hypothetical protein
MFGLTLMLYFGYRYVFGLPALETDAQGIILILVTCVELVVEYCALLIIDNIRRYGI